MTCARERPLNLLKVQVSRAAGLVFFCPGYKREKDIKDPVERSRALEKRAVFFCSRT